MNGLSELDYQKYTDFLEKQIRFRYVMFVLFTVLFILLAVSIFCGWIRGTKKESSIKSKIICVLICFCLFSFIFFGLGRQIHSMNTDVKQQSFLVYDGEFIYRYERQRKGHISEIIFTVNGEEIVLVAENPNIDSGTYRGRVIYSENSKYLLDYKIYE